MCEEAGIHAHLVGDDAGTPHHVLGIDIVQAHERADGDDLAATGVDGLVGSGLGIGPLVLDHADARLDGLSNSVVDVALLILIARNALQQLAGVVDVLVDLLIDSGIGGTRLALRLRRSGLYIERHARFLLVAYEGAGEILREHEVGVGTDGVGLSDGIVLLLCGALHGFLGCDDVVGIGNPVVVGIPQVVRTPRTGGVAALHVVDGIEPEPARALSLHDVVVAHDVGAEVVGRDAEALVGVAGGRPSGGVHLTINTIQGDQRRLTVAEQSLTRHVLRGDGLDLILRAAREHQASQQGDECIFEY